MPGQDVLTLLDHGGPVRVRDAAPGQLGRTWRDEDASRCRQPAATQLYLVTVLYNGEASLPGFLDSLKAQTYRDWRLIAVDNASRDRSCEVVAATGDDRVTLVRNTANLGFAKATNQGLRAAVAAGGEFVVLFNNDTLFGPDFLRELVEARAALGAEVIAPRIMYMEQPDEAWYAGGHLEDGWQFQNVHEPYDPSDARPARRVEFASGCCLGLTRGVLEHIGLLNESFFVYWEDVDFCLRLNAAGIPILYVSEPSLLHEGAVASGGAFSPSHIRLYYRSYMQLLRKQFGWRRALRTMLRLVAREIERPNRDLRLIRNLAGAMMRGLVAPLVEDTRLT